MQLQLEVHLEVHQSPLKVHDPLDLLIIRKTHRSSHESIFPELFRSSPEVLLTAEELPIAIAVEPLLTRFPTGIYFQQFIFQNVSTSISVMISSHWSLYMNMNLRFCIQHMLYK